MALAALLLALLPGVAFAVHDITLFELDGNAVNDITPGDDWQNISTGTSSSLTNTFIGSNVESAALDTTYFTGGGSKDVNDINQWQYSSTDVAPDKDQITNAYAAAYVKNGKLLVYFGADRFANNGDSQVTALALISFA